MLGENKIASAPNESQTYGLLVGSHPIYHGGLLETHGELSRLIRSMVSHFPHTAKIDTWCSRRTMMLMKMINFKPGIFGVNEDVI